MFVFDLWLMLPFMLAALPQAIFVIVYATPALGAGDWWHDPVGKALFFKSLTLAVVFNLLTVRLLNVMYEAPRVVFKTSPPDGGWDRTFAVLYWCVLFAVLYQLAVLIHQRWMGRRP